MDDALQRRLDRIVRRQRYILLLLVYPYLAGGVWLALREPVVAVAAPALGIVVVAYLVTLVRARTGGDASDGAETVAE
jgi:hypothetical protein